MEGPILAVIVGFLWSLGILNAFIAYPIIIAGDIVGDTLCYLLGKLGIPKFLKKWAIWIGIKPSHIAKVREYFKNNHIKTIALSKIALGIGVAGIYIAGNARIAYNKFLTICIIVSCLQFAVYIVLGVFFGHAYQAISHVLDATGAALIIFCLAVLTVFLIRSSLKRV